MTYPNEEQIAELAQLIRDRDRAQSMIKQWQRKLDEANAALAAMMVAQTQAPAHEQEQEPAPEQV